MPLRKTQRKTRLVLSCIAMIVALIVTAPQVALAQDSVDYSEHSTPNPEAVLPQEADSGKGPQQEGTNAGRDDHKTITFEFSPKARWTLLGDLDNGPGEVSVSRQGFDLEMEYQPSKRWQLKLEYNFEHSCYDFDGATGLVPGTGNPYGDVYGHLLSGTFIYMQSRKLMWLGGMELLCSGESDVDFDNSFLVGGYGGVIWRMSDDFTLIGGVFIKEELEDDPLILPYINFRWKIQDALRLNLQGPKLELVYDLNDKWGISLLGEYNMRDYRLSDDAIISGGAVKDDRVVAGAALTWKPLSSVKIQLQGGLIPYQEFEIKDSDGHTISDDNTDPKGFVGSAASINF